MYIDCNCKITGSNSLSCDSNGVCSCKTNVIGAKCTACKSGYYGFPNCKGNADLNILFYNS